MTVKKDIKFQVGDRIRGLFSRYISELEQLPNIYNDINEYFLEDYPNYLEESRRALKFPNASEEELNKIYKMMKEYDDQQSEKLDLLIWFSVFSYQYHIFEFVLNKSCDVIQTGLKIQLKLTDLRGLGIERSKLYLKKVCEVNFPDSNSYWNLILLFRQLRHNIIHNNGIVEDTEKNKVLINFIKARIDISLNENQQVKFGIEFISYSNKIIIEFLSLIQGLLVNKYPATNLLALLLKK